MATVVQHRDRPARPYHRVPWSPRAWSKALYLAGGIPALLAAALVVVGSGRHRSSTVAAARSWVW